MLKCSLYAILLALAALLYPRPADAALAKSRLLEDNVAYVRVTQTETNLADEIQSALSHLTGANPLAGIVLDLRFANGTDSDNLKATEDVLTGQKLPLAILVNAETSGAAATLANDLRNANTGLIFGSATASLKPDITVAVSASDEKSFLKNPYKTLGATNSTPDTNLLNMVDIDHTSEADLVRERIQGGQENDTAAPLTNNEPKKLSISDPVLAHGVDFIKGLAALRLNKS